MNTTNAVLQSLLQLAAAMQFGIALLNLALNRMMGWEEDLNRMPLLIREVHQVHSWFISIILTIFATLTWRFAPDFVSGTNLVCRWLAGAIGLFWGFRT